MPNVDIPNRSIIPKNTKSNDVEIVLQVLDSQREDRFVINGKGIILKSSPEYVVKEIIYTGPVKIRYEKNKIVILTENMPKVYLSGL